MDNFNEVFSVDFNANKLNIEEVTVPGQTFFKIRFPNDKVLIILRATNIDGAKFWTSVPEGNQKTAEQVGPLIEQYYRSKKK